jgi:hypothetical protein
LSRKFSFSSENYESSSFIALSKFFNVFCIIHSLGWKHLFILMGYEVSIPEERCLAIEHVLASLALDTHGSGGGACPG